MTNTPAEVSPTIDLEVLAMDAAQATMDNRMATLRGETLLALVAAVKAARAHVNDPPLMTQHLSWHEKYNALVEALQPFTVTK